MEWQFASLFLIIPFISIGLLFVKDGSKKRRLIINILILLNIVVYLLPMLGAYLGTPSGESVFNENSGGGAMLWFYMLILPLSGFLVLIFTILKIVFFFNSKDRTG